MNWFGVVFGTLLIVLIVISYSIQMRKRKRGLSTRNAYEWLNSLLLGRKNDDSEITSDLPKTR